MNTLKQKERRTFQDHLKGIQSRHVVEHFHVLISIDIRKGGNHHSISGLHSKVSEFKNKTTRDKHRRDVDCGICHCGTFMNTSEDTENAQGDTGLGKALMRLEPSLSPITPSLSLQCTETSLDLETSREDLSRDPHLSSVLQRQQNSDCSLEPLA